MPVVYRSNSDPDYMCLEKYLESGAFGKLPDAWRHQAQQDLESLNKFVQNLAANTPWISDEYIEQIMFSDIEIPTKFDSPFNFRIINNLVVRIKSAAKRVGLDVSKFPHFSSIPTRRVNACAVNLPCSSKPFLLFDSQLLLYCHLFAKAFARCLPVTNDGEMVSLSTDIKKVQNRVSNTPEVLEKLADVLNAYVTTDAPSNSKAYTLEREYVSMTAIIRDGMELFVVAHEFGHVYAGHLKDLLTGCRLPTSGLWKYSASHKQEHEADLIGLLLTLHAMNESGYDAGLSYIGVDLFFRSLDLAERYTHILNEGGEGGFESEESESHPSNQSRRIFLDEAIEHIITPAEQLVAARSIIHDYNLITSYLLGEVIAKLPRRS
ncbi:hypothetical protein KP005_05045 [Geomonas nitrogeniifigens]|uniref:Peptidase M48 domain-containing protein n=1 Tax=Geomonas diazotrophica TaxID=2843197 RepID=A0ABX8JM77_9BACT|nr:hypothetical protein [Geomonas nitrogeniifigens]QWV98657.1 hypothetical protein KP005_05045 [Geomonas nitrogeniifigens]